MSTSPGNNDYIQQVLGKYNPVWSGGGPRPSMDLPDHIIPVRVTIGDGISEGLVVPMRIQPASQWHLSDAFGRFGSLNQPLHEAFDTLLELLEDQWKSCFRTILPLAWRQPFAITIVPPIHMEAIAGRSLQWPLALALLRASCTDRGHMPLGRGPVFATGTQLESGAFGPVNGVKEKLFGFVREFGRNRPILLTHEQRNQFKDDDLAGLTVHVVNSLHDLFKLDAISRASDMVAPPAREQDLDLALNQMKIEASRARFEKVTTMAEWLLPATTNLPAYAFRIHILRGEMFLHAGRTAESHEYWEESRKILSGAKYVLDKDAKAEFAAQVLTYLMDIGASNFYDAKELFAEEEVRMLADEASAAVGAALNGELSQFYRAIGDLESALECADRAMELARIGQISLAGKYNNFGIHALLARARQSSGSFGKDMAAIARRLDESRGTLCPTHDPKMRELHLGFCRHYEAEWHRLSRRSYSVRRLDRPLGTWDHPYLFALLSCVRNPFNPFPQREEAADWLLDAAEKLRKCSEDAPIFRMFEGVYHLVHAHIHEKGLLPHIEALEELLSPEPSMTLWKKRLWPHLVAIRDGDTDRGLDALCDAIPHH